MSRKQIHILKVNLAQKSKKSREQSAILFDDDEREVLLNSDADLWQKKRDIVIVNIISPEQATKIPKHLALPISSRFALTDKGEKELNSASIPVVPRNIQDEII